METAILLAGTRAGGRPDPARVSVPPGLSRRLGSFAATRRSRVRRIWRTRDLAPFPAYASGAGLRNSWMACTTTEPSPTLEATRLTDPERTSPTA